MLRGRVVHINGLTRLVVLDQPAESGKTSSKIFAGRSRICIGEQIIAHDMMRVMLKFGRSGEHGHYRGGRDEPQGSKIHVFSAHYHDYDDRLSISIRNNSEVELNRVTAYKEREREREREREENRERAGCKMN